MGFEPTRAEHIGLAVQRLNHSATVSHDWRSQKDGFKIKNRNFKIRIIAELKVLEHTCPTDPTGIYTISGPSN